ncbi:transporter substrate-binding domain-containing protein [Shewanella sp. D64]|uniref:transporter substrate-binding domain-containing protein n=1 Tax=unclassified Shewanella TaxID=196818 RepID=UPI0022BA3855|nr:MULTISPECIES: transporter substrate-binding domain-containing protein [unclassified Shewanella]MEC4725590.1 transporter substrate-binding domain-containing protein [Shewanella sp. D64]MEC4739642.1 transporter substrate-binding domain-containing protein [Shewanella sp. E94]WBJ94891.1 transporter substrate-binding domain-containing protein [Shewanella sp. MTB7]
MRFFALSKLITKCLFLIFLGGISVQVMARDLDEIQAEGILRHLGVPYASFVTQYTEGNKKIHSGLDIELMQNFATHLGVEYQFIPATWTTVFGKLTGRNGQFINNQVIYSESQDIEGDVMAHGVTVLDWRKEIVDFSDDYFPSAVWLIARIESDLDPIVPSGSINKDITAVKSLIKGREVLAMKQSCLDPDLYNLYKTNAKVILSAKQLQLNEMVPAILNNEAEMTLLDIADSLIALEKWPNKIKVIGPISEEQRMAMGFRKGSPKLREAFNAYLKQIRLDGSYKQLIKKYYPSVFHYYQDYFSLPIESQ